MEKIGLDTRQWLRNCLTATTGYILFAALSIALAVLVPAINAPIWAPAGFAFAILRLKSLRCWPGVWLGAWLAHKLVSGTLPPGISDIILPSAATAQAVLGAWLISKAGRWHDHQQGALRVALRIFYAAPLPCALFSVAGIAIAGGFSAYSPALVSASMIAWWSANCLGVLLVAPAVLFLWPQQPPRLPGAAKSVLLNAFITGTAILAAHYWLSVVQLNSSLALTREKLTNLTPDTSY